MSQCDHSVITNTPPTTTPTTTTVQHHRKSLSSSSSSSSSSPFSFSFSSNRYSHLSFVTYFIVSQILLVLIVTLQQQGAYNGVQCSSLAKYGHTLSPDPDDTPIASLMKNDQCPAGWVWFQDRCLVFINLRKDFDHAAELCRLSYFNSVLPTIHSPEYNDFLRANIINLKDNSNPIWLYARHNHQYNKTTWLDKSVVTYRNWDRGQPSDKTSLVCIQVGDSFFIKKTEQGPESSKETQCVSMWADGKWGTQLGCNVFLPVVCEKKLPRKGNDTNVLAEMNTYETNPSGSMDNQPIPVLMLTFVTILVAAFTHFNTLSPSF